VMLPPRARNVRILKAGAQEKKIYATKDEVVESLGNLGKVTECLLVSYLKGC
jgi:hypothetical protein